MKRIYKKEEGVSPVIATILMVAITVVLAATVWLLVSGYMGGGTNTPLTMSLTYNAQQSNETQAIFDVSMSQPSQASYTNVKITLKSGSTSDSGTLNDKGWTNITINSKTYAIHVIDLNGNGKLDTGDQIVIDGHSGTSWNKVNGLTIYIYITGYSGNGQGSVPS